MLYLSKRISSIVNRVAGTRLDPAARQEQRRAKLGFSMDLAMEYETVSRSFGIVPRAIGKRGSKMLYVVAGDLARLTRQEEDYAEEAKALVVESLAEGAEEIGMRLFGRAKETAQGFLAARMAPERSNLVSYIVAHDTVGYGPISMLLEDKQKLEEIEINAPDASISVFHVDYGRCETNLSFRGEREFRHCINRMIYEADKELSDDSPIIDAQVEDARVHAQMRPYALSGAAASIRIGDQKTVCFDYLIRKRTTSFDTLAYLWMVMDAGMNVLVAGSPASGKTTLMSALFSFIPRSERLITIEEDVNELKAKIDINNTVELYGSRYMGAVTTTREQVINALRMRPDRIVVGELRGAEAQELFAGASLGVPFMTTMHSNEEGTDIVKKLMIKPMAVQAGAIGALDIALYMRHADLSRRLLSAVYEYRWLSNAETMELGSVVAESDSVDVSTVVRNGELDRAALQKSKVIEAFSRKSGISARLALKELDKRASYLEELYASNGDAAALAEAIQTYGWK